MQPNYSITRINAVRSAYRSSNAPLDRHSLPPPQPPTPAAAIQLSSTARQQAQQLVHAQGPPLVKIPKAGARTNGKTAKDLAADDRETPMVSGVDENQSSDLDTPDDETTDA